MELAADGAWKRRTVPYVGRGFVVRGSRFIAPMSAMTSTVHCRVEYTGCGPLGEQAIGNAKGPSKRRPFAPIDLRS